MALDDRITKIENGSLNTLFKDSFGEIMNDSACMALEDRILHLENNSEKNRDRLDALEIPKFMMYNRSNHW